MRGFKKVLVFGKHRIGVKIGKSHQRDYGLKASMICPECYEKQEVNPVNMKFVCSVCGQQFNKKDIELRQDKETGTIFNEKDKEAYMKVQSSDEIQIISEVSIEDIFRDGIELLDGNFYEVFNNDKAVRKIHKILRNKGTAYFVSFYMYGSMKYGIITATNKKLLLAVFRDSALVKQPATDIEGEENEVINEIAQHIVSDKAEKYLEFIESVQSGQVGTKIVEKQEKEIEEDLSFLDEEDLVVAKA